MKYTNFIIKKKTHHSGSLNGLLLIMNKLLDTCCYDWKIWSYWYAESFIKWLKNFTFTWMACVYIFNLQNKCMHISKTIIAVDSKHFLKTKTSNINTSMLFFNWVLSNLGKYYNICVIIRITYQKYIRIFLLRKRNEILCYYNFFFF